MLLASPARALRLTGAAIALAVMAGCGSDSKSSGDATASTAAPTVEGSTVAPTTAATVAPTTVAAATTSAASATTTAGGGTSVAVTESEFKIDLPSTNFTAGTYTFDITNSGQFKHSLVIDGPGVDQQKSDLVSPGGSGSLTVTLAPGTYDVYCGVPTHKGKGMDVSITVT